MNEHNSTPHVFKWGLVSKTTIAVAGTVLISLCLLFGLWVRAKPATIHLNETRLTATSSVEVSSSTVADKGYTDWKIYRNDKWGFSFKYPPQVEVEEVDGPYEIHVFVRLDNYLKISSNEKDELKKYFPDGAFAKGTSPVLVTMDIKERVQPNPAHKDIEAVMHDEPGDAFSGYEYGSTSKINTNYKVLFQGLPAVRLMINNVHQGFSGTVSYFALHPNNDQLRVEAHLSVPFKDVPENIQFPSWYSYFEKSLPLQEEIIKTIEYFPAKKNIQKAVDQLSQ